MQRDVIFIVGPGNVALGHSELRYALRSLALVPHGAVWLVGTAPAWTVGVKGIHVPKLCGRLAKWRHAKKNLQAIVGSVETPDEFWLWHDDMIVTRPIEEPPMFHVGTLREHADRVRSQYPNSGYVRALLETADLLGRNGIRDPLSYEFHSPFLHTKDGLREALKMCAGNPRLCERSVDGNMRGLSVPFGEDVKVYGPVAPEPIPSIVSFSDDSWRQMGGSTIRKMLREPGPYEQVYTK